MYIVAIVVHIITCLLLIGVVLLQQGKGADMGAVFGGSSSTIFGSSGAGNFLTRLTTIMAVVFMLTSLTLTWAGARHVTSTVFDDAPVATTEDLGAGVAPAPEAAGPGVAAPAAQAPEANVPAAAPAEPQAAAPAAAPAGEAAPN